MWFVPEGQVTAPPGAGELLEGGEAVAAGDWDPLGAWEGAGGGEAVAPCGVDPPGAGVGEGEADDGLVVGAAL